MRVAEYLRAKFGALTPRRRQWAALTGVLAAAFIVMWVLFASADPVKLPAAAKGSAQASKVTNVDVMAAGAQVTPLDSWVGTAGKKMAQYERDKEQQERLNKEADAFKADVMKRFSALDERMREMANASPAEKQPAPAPTPAQAPPAPAYPPAAALPAGSQAAGAPALPGKPGQIGYPPGAVPGAEAGRPELVRVAVTEKPKAAASNPNGSAPAQKAAGAESAAATGTVDTYLPVSFTRGTLLGGLDAPTGGQAQSNPHPVLIRLEDNAILPNRFRSNVRECFVIAAGYGDIASERAYLRTENLSCVRNDGSTLEVKIQGSVFGEDGLVGLRGNLVTKQGQMLANALLAGLLSGIGQGFAAQSSTITASTFGTISTTEGSHAFRQGVGAGVGRALDRLANYYIKLAENTFPVIEIGAGRSVDVVITKGVRIEGGDLAKAEAAPASTASRGGELAQAGADDEY